MTEPDNVVAPIAVFPLAIKEPSTHARIKSGHDVKRGARVVFAALFLSLSLAACELRPLYATDNVSAAPIAELEAIQIARVSGSTDRTGLLVRNNLLDRLNPRGEPSRPRYRLDVVLEEFKEATAITRSDEATRTNLVIAARYRLVDLASNRAIHANEVRNATAFNILRADFGNVAAEQDARQRLSRELAEAIRTELASWLARPRS